MKKQPDCLAVGLSPAIQKTLILKRFKKGEVNRSEEYFTDASGKCINVCRVLTQGGMNASCLTIAGRENRTEFELLCKKDSLDISLVETTGRVRICTTIVDRNMNQCTELVVNEPELITENEEKAFIGAFNKKLSDSFKVVIISGSKIKGFSDKIIPLMVKVVKKHKCLVIADYRGEDLRNSFQTTAIRPDYIKINEDEFFETFPDYNDLEQGLKEISDHFNCAFIITRGAKSTIAADRGSILIVESIQIKALNPIGCGDAMTAGLAQGILEGLSLKHAIEKGRDYATLNALTIHPGWILTK